MLPRPRPRISRMARTPCFRPRMLRMLSRQTTLLRGGRVYRRPRISRMAFQATDAQLPQDPTTDLTDGADVVLFKPRTLRMLALSDHGFNGWPGCRSLKPRMLRMLPCQTTTDFGGGLWVHDHGYDGWRGCRSFKPRMLRMLPRQTTHGFRQCLWIHDHG
jgi:hypothetical protein